MIKVELLIQDPTSDALPYAVDAIADAASGATSGRAIFAFATVAGVDLLLGHDAIQRLVKRGTFEVIVGIDAVTNRETLERLSAAARAAPGLRPRVFWNRTTGLFHPKFCYFQGDRHDTWIIGSGNLSPRGLRDSYEAFVVVTGPRADLAYLEGACTQFLDSHRTDIREIDLAALKRASKNKPSQAIRRIEPLASKPGRRVPGASGSLGPILVAELPRGGGRWQQANFDFATARDFFGIDPATPSLGKELFLNELDSAGTALREEVRRFTFTKSHNLRIQLAAKAGAAYPTHNRPIAVFRALGLRRFAYQLLLPGSRGYRDGARLLQADDAGGVRRRIVSIAELRKVWPKCVLA